MYINFILFLVSKSMLIRHYQVETIRNKDTCYLKVVLTSMIAEYGIRGGVITHHI